MPEEFSLSTDLKFTLSTEHPANELGPEQLLNAQKVTANVTKNEDGAEYLVLTVDYSGNTSLIQMHALNDDAREADKRFSERALPWRPSL